MITFLVIVLIIAIIVIGILLYMISNLLNQIKDLEEALQKTDELESKVILYHEVLIGIFTNAYSEFLRVDKLGSFSGDDEVGWSFNLLRDVIKDVVEKLNTIKNDVRGTSD